MNLSNYFQCAFLLGLVFAFSACKKEETSTPTFDPSKKGKIVLEFDQVVGDTDLKFGTNYKNAAGEEFNIDFLQYYVSNIKLKSDDGREYIVPQDKSYFLIRESLAESREITLSDIPEGNYTELSFILGVDSLRNTMDLSKRTGVLDPAGEGAGMYWMWNSGYIFFKMEGISPAAPVGQDGLKKFRYHIGGFGGYNAKTINNIKTITLPFPEKGTVRASVTPQAHIVVDLMKVFNGTTTLSIAKNPTVMFAPFSVDIAKNYEQMFEIHHVHND